MTDWTAIDAGVVAGYFVVVVAIGLWAGRGGRDATSYFLAGRTLPWYLIGFSFYASNMSGASFVGLIGASYSHGMVVFNYEWTAALVLIVLAVFMLPVFLRSQLFTVPEYLEARFDRRSRWAYALFTILTLLFIDMAGALYAGGIVISTVFPGLMWPAASRAPIRVSGRNPPESGRLPVMVSKSPVVERGVSNIGFLRALQDRMAAMPGELPPVHRPDHPCRAGLGLHVP